MKKILETLKQKWAEYLLEMIVITAGILGAYSLNNWNETRITHNRTQNILRQIKADLAMDKGRLENKIKSNDRILQRLRDLEDLTPDNLPDSLSYMLERSHRISEWNPVITGYNSYLELGEDMILPKELDEGISYCYTNFSHETSQIKAKDLSLYALNQYRQLLIKYGFPITIEIFGIRPPKDTESMGALLEDPQFKGVIRNYQYGFAAQSEAYQGVIKLMDELSETIDNYFRDN